MAAKRRAPSEFLNDEDKKILQELDEFCKNLKEAGQTGGETPDPLNSNKLWKTLYKCAEKSPNMMYAFIFNTVQLYRQVMPEFTTVSDPFISARVKELESKSSTNASRINTVIPLIRLMPFFDEVTALTVIHSSIEVVEKHIRQKQELPKDFIAHFKDVPVEEMYPSTFQEIVTYFKEIELTPGSVAILAVLASDMQKINDSLLQFFNQIVIDFLGGEKRESKLAGAWFLHKFAYTYQDMPEDAPSVAELLDLLRPILVDKDRVLSSMAHKAIKSLIKARVFMDEDAITSIVDIFGDYDEKMISQFFMLIHTIMYPNQEEKEDEKNVMLFVPIRNFVIDKLGDPDVRLEVKGYCINIVADFMSIKKTFVSNCWGLAWKATLDILKKKAVTVYPYITSFLAGTARNFKKKIPAIAPYIIKIVEELPKETCAPLSERLDMAVDIAEMITLRVIDSPPPVLGAFATKGLQSKNMADAVRSCAVFLEALPVVSDAVATHTVEKISQHAREADTVSVLEFFIKTMRKLVERCNISKSKPFHQFMNDLCHGRLKNFQGKPGALFSEGSKLINVYIKKFPDMIPNILNLYEEFSKQVAPSHIPLFLAPYKTILSVVQLSDENLKKLWDICIGYLHKSAEKHLPSILATVEVLTEIWKSNSYICDQLDVVVEVCSTWIERMDVSHIKDDVMKFLIEMMPSMAYLLFLFVSSGREVKISNKIFANIFKSMPFPPEVKIQGEMLRQMAKIIEANRLPKLEKDILVTMVELLVLDEADLKEFEFEESAIQSMKKAVKNKLGGDPKLLKEVKGIMINAQRDQQALAALLE